MPTVLIVDDDSDIRAIVRSVVELLNYTPVEAGDGFSALAAFNEHHPDLVVLDVMMPGLDGNEVRAHLKAGPDGELVPVLMLTAKDGMEDKIRSLKNGADDYLTKPFHYGELQARIESLMRIRVLNLELHKKNLELQSIHSRLVSMERQHAVSQLAGTAAHKLGQPLSAIMLNCHLVETFSKGDPRFERALEAIKRDSRRMAELLKRLVTADAEATETYFKDDQILSIDNDAVSVEVEE